MKLKDSDVESRIAAGDREEAVALALAGALEVESTAELVLRLCREKAHRLEVSGETIAVVREFDRRDELNKKPPVV